MNEKIPVYLIDGFLESGKTQFLSFTLAQDYFQVQEKTLLIVCEEGIEEYDQETLAKCNTDMVVIEEEEDFSVEKMQQLQMEYRPGRIVIEYNGMWNIKDLQFPGYWELAQQITLVDATTFDNYFANMKSIFVEMVRRSDLVLFNRCKETDDLASYKRSVRAVNQKTEVVFEDLNGDNIDEVLDEDLPYDVNADLIVVGDDDFGIFYLDALDNQERYEGKRVTFTGMVYKNFKFQRNDFVPGRQVMTCCAEDVAFLGFLCKSKEAKRLTTRQWVKVTGTMKYEYRREYSGEGPVLYADTVEPSAKPAVEVINLN